MRSWTVGKVKVTQIVEQVIATGIPGLLPDATPEALLAIPWLYPEFVTERGEPTMSLHALVLDTPTKRVLVDTCIGNDKHLPIAPIWDRMQTDFLDKMAAAGFARESIDMVICTHLHLDHVGWNTMKVDDQWVPTGIGAAARTARLRTKEAQLAIPVKCARRRRDGLSFNGPKTTA